MTTKLNAAQVQGTEVGNAPLCSDFEAFNPCSRAKNHLLRAGKAYLAVLFLVLNCHFGLKGQNGVNVDVDEYGFEVIAPNVTLDSGESAVLTIKVGTASNQVSDAMEFSIDLDLGDHTVLPQSGDLDVGSSWFFSSSPGSIQLTTDAASHVVTISGSNSPYQSGYGTVFTIELEATTNGANASDLILDGGGMILVDEAGFKTSPVQPLEVGFQVKAYPNPFKAEIQFRWGEEKPESVSFYNLQGRKVAILNQLEIEQGAFNGTRLEPGIYHVVVQFSDGRKSVQKLLKQ